MTNIRASRRAARGAFTLIELLVVIAIIAILAALIFPAAGAIKRRATITKVQAELKQVTTFIDLYKEKLSFYPPDNPNNPMTNQLYFELAGTTNTYLNPPGASGFRTLDGSAEILTTSIPSTFGGSGFVNISRGGGDDSTPAKDFLKGIKPRQYAEIAPKVRVLTCSVLWPGDVINPWRYMSSAPTNNPGSYDLWVDVLIAGKTNRISNWSQQPQLVATP